MAETAGLDMVTVKLVTTGQLGAGETISTPHDAVRVMGDMLRDLDREHLCVINLKADLTPVNCNIVSVGDIDSSLACPALIVKSAILCNATKIIVLHNHPSGNVKPSSQDKEVTEKIRYTCNMVGITMLDHIIVGGNLCYSFHLNETLFTQDYDMGQDEKRMSDRKIRTFTDVLEKYFLTPAREGFTYQDRLQEGYEMLDMIAEDLDRISGKDIKIRDYLEQMAEQEGILENKQIPVIQHNLRKGR